MKFKFNGAFSILFDMPKVFLGGVVYKNLIPRFFSLMLLFNAGAMHRYLCELKWIVKDKFKKGKKEAGVWLKFHNTP